MQTTTMSGPLYLQIKDTLLAQIKSGVYTCGQQIPTESALADIFSVSRVTIRKALKEDMVRNAGEVSCLIILLNRRDRKNLFRAK